MKVRGEKTEEENEMVEADVDDQADQYHLDHEDPRHSMYIIYLNFDFNAS